MTEKEIKRRLTIQLTRMRKNIGEIPKSASRLTEEEADYIYTRGYIECIETIFEVFWDELI